MDGAAVRVGVGWRWEEGDGDRGVEVRGGKMELFVGCEILITVICSVELTPSAGP